MERKNNKQTKPTDTTCSNTVQNTTLSNMPERKSNHSDLLGLMSIFCKSIAE